MVAQRSRSPPKHAPRIDVLEVPSREFGPDQLPLGSRGGLLMLLAYLPGFHIDPNTIGVGGDGVLVVQGGVLDVEALTMT